MFDLDPLLLLPLALVLGLMALPNISRKLYGPINYVQPNEVAALLQEGNGPPVIDVRSERAFRNEHVPGTAHVAADDVPAFLADKPSGVILVCQSDSVSVRLAARLRKAGHNGISVMQGGIFRWKRSRLPLHRKTN